VHLPAFTFSCHNGQNTALRRPLIPPLLRVRSEVNPSPLAFGQATQLSSLPLFRQTGQILTYFLIALACFIRPTCNRLIVACSRQSRMSPSAEAEQRPQSSQPTSRAERLGSQKVPLCDVQSRNRETNTLQQKQGGSSCLYKDWMCPYLT
jgi:hypothetical protein